MIRYFRAHGLGNDYLVVDFLQTRVVESPAVIRRLCDRHEGIGADGALVKFAPRAADFGVRIYNPDGSMAEKSGNGVRIFARYLYDEGLLHFRATLETAGGQVQLQLVSTPTGLEIEADMGIPQFVCREIPVTCDSEELVEAPFVVAGHSFKATAVSMGNPHFVLFVEDLTHVPLQEIGPLIECHPLFPNRTNVQFARVLSPDAVEVRIWERGAGETRASGSSACAVVAAGIRTGRLSPHVAVHMAGGTLQVRQDERGHLFQQGPVKVISRGEVSEELEAELLTL